MKHTPGPWKLYMASGCANVHVGETHKCVAHFSEDQIIAEWQGFQYVGADGLPRWDMKEEIRANARLIAASPELLEACQEIELALRHGNEVDSDTWNMLTAAIARATGEE